MITIDLKEGQTYICTKAYDSWWTEVKEYEVVLDKYGSPVLTDNDGFQFNSTYVTTDCCQFKLKDMQENDVEREYTSCDVNKIIIKAYQTYNNDAQRLAFIKGYFAK